MSASWLIEKPLDPSQWDDEFEADDLDPRWTKVGASTSYQLVDSFDPYNTNAETITRYSLRARRSWLMTQGRSSGNTGHYYEQNVTGLPNECFLYVRASCNTRRTSIVDNDGEVGLALVNSTNNDRFLVMFDAFTNIIEGFCRRDSGGTGVNLGLIRSYFGEAFPLEYFGIQRLGAVCHGWCATGAGNWVWLGTFTFPSSAFDRVRLNMNNNVTTAPGRMIVGADFFRVLSGRKLP